MTHSALCLKRPWRKEIQWNRGERKGPIIDIEVDDASVDRALLVAEKLIAAAAAVGRAFKEERRWALSHRREANAKLIPDDRLSGMGRALHRPARSAIVDAA